MILGFTNSGKYGVEDGKDECPSYAVPEEGATNNPSK